MTDNPHDAACDRWTTFAELRVGDRIDYWWGPARTVLEHTAYADGRVRIVVDNGIGRDFALAPGTTKTRRTARSTEQ
ncbi:hypothetical protein AB0939_12030 [Streptomyces sp. NPDC006990]|uniref:hypothetical protein n=1 Tax=Streptomyces sp. NPDC006990 TaxID=3154481 RepID=UPI0034513250